MAKVEFTDKNNNKVKVETNNNDTYYLGYLDDMNYQINQRKNNAYIKTCSKLFDKYYDGTIKSIWNDISREMYKKGFNGFLWVRKDDTSEVRQRLGSKIKEIRKHEGLTAKEFARKVNIDAGNLSRIEKGQISVGIDTLNRIAGALNMRIDFVPRKETPTPKEEKKEEYNPQSTISIGKNSDTVEELERLCNQKAKELATNIDISNQKEVSVPFWTDDFPSELICVCNISLDKKGNPKYDLDYSQSTM